MNDILGQSLALGDVVAVPDGSGFPNSLRLGRIIRRRQDGHRRAYQRPPDVNEA